MKIAIPIVNGRLCMHFGHCEQFAVFDVDKEKKSINSTAALNPPPHEPGVLPKWLHDRGVNCIIAGGMGSRAAAIFRDNDIDVVTGAPAGAPEDIVSQYLNGTLVTGDNTCDH